ncbi:NAD(P)-binding protein [Aspergillus parasiticus]|uniref:NAD(P)-binding protein n=1 Tax=Aspergillus parasiticus TaxID=5067 RepID=A0A5N6DGT7_ASPPA|nr:NAD(P)-binding protein [Aspergillus parasiticus]
MASQQPEFRITPNLIAGLRMFFYSQLFVTPLYPESSFADQTVIVTGSNTGLGLEAARHFYRLNCAHLILAVRIVIKGQTAKEEIIDSLKHSSDPDANKIWELDQSSTASTLAFADRVKTELPRVDVLVENAVQVNVLNTFSLALALLPKLNVTKEAFPESQPHLVIVSFEAHRLTNFPEINAPDLYAKLSEREAFSQQPRYQVTKLIEVLFMRELVARLKSKTVSAPSVIINIVNPGLCFSNLDRSGSEPPLIVRIMRRILDRTTEVGGRTLVLAAAAPASSHGEFQSDGANQDVESWIYSDIGRRAQEKVFDQTMKVLEARKPGLAHGIGL